MAKSKQVTFSQRIDIIVEQLNKKDKLTKSDLVRKGATLYSHLYSEVSEQIQKSTDTTIGGETEIVL